MKVKKWLGFLLAIVMMLSVAAVFSACTNNPNTNEDKITVTWYDVRTQLKQEEITKGSKATEWTPTKEGYVFAGWFEEASLTNPFDFTVPLETDTNIFSKWRSAEVVKDTRLWFAIGVMNNWTMSEKNDDGEWVAREGQDVLTQVGDNTYEITLTLRPNQKFRFATNLTDSNWTSDGETTSQAGLGNMEGFDFAEGVNPEKSATVTKDSKEYGEVRNADGDLVFFGGYEFNMPSYTWNIWLAEGQDGKYKFTLTTYPGDDTIDPGLVEIKWELVEKLEELESTHDMYITGTLNSGDNWKDDYESAIKLTRDNNDQTLWKGFFTVTTADYASWAANEGPFGTPCASIKVKNAISGQDFGVLGNASGTIGGENIFLLEGDYCITYSEKDNKIFFEKLDYYVIGTFLDGDTAVNFAVKAGVTPAMTLEGGVYTAELTVVDVTGNESYSWVASESDGGIFAIKVVYGCSLGVPGDKWFGFGETGNDNYFFTEAGDYIVTFDPATSVITVDTAVEKVTVTFYDGETVLSTEKIEIGSTVTAPEAPHKAGYNFIGWYADAAFATEFDFTAAINENTSVYAKYEEDVTITVYTVSFYKVIDGGDAELLFTEQVEAGDRFTKELPTEAGFTVEGWYTDAACTVPYEAEGVNADMSLYAKYTTIVISVDDRDWYLVGEFTTGSWTELKDENKFTRGENDEENLTVYTITVELDANNQIKVASNGYLSNGAANFWDGSQMGFEQVKPANSNLEDAGGNIKVLKHGEYKITLHIDPAAANVPYENDPASIGSSYIVVELVREITDVVLDQREYFLVGASQGTLGENWNKGTSGTFKRVEGTNTYELKNFTIIEGDQFQLRFNASSWGNDGSYQFGAYFFGKFAPNVFPASTGWNDNAKVSAGKSGIYNITLVTAGANTETTARAESQIVSFTFELVSAIQTKSEVIGYYIVGTSTSVGWWSAGSSKAENYNAYKLESTDGVNYTWTGTLLAGACKIVEITRTTNANGSYSDAVSDWIYPANDQSTTAGTYTVTLNLTSRSGSFTKA